MMSRILVCGAIGLAVAAFAAPIFPARSSSIWIDPVTGSMKTQSHFLFIPTNSTIDQSALERWIIGHERAYTPTWKFLSDQYQTIFGRTLCRGCGSAPEIYLLRSDGFGLNSDFVRRASDAEIAKFVKVMRTGTRDEQRQAVETAADRARSPSTR